MNTLYSSTPPPNYQDQEENFDIKELLYKYLSKWYWFFLFAVMGLAVSYIFLRYQTNIYQVSSSVLIKEERQKGIGMENMFNGMTMGPYTKLSNHISIYRSYNIHNQTLLNLKWNVSWFADGKVKDSEIYGDEPCQVLFTEEDVNLKETKINFIPLTFETFKIIVYKPSSFFKLKKEVYIEQDGKYGIPFEHPSLHFTLIKKRDFSTGEKFYFIFNNLMHQTMNYMGKVSAAAATIESDILKLTLSGPVAAKDADYLNELNRVFINYGLNLKNKLSKNTVDFIEGQLSGVTASLDESGQNFTDFKSRNRLVDVSYEATSISDKIKDVEQEKAVIDMQLEYYRNTKKYLDDPSRIKKMVSPSVVGITDPSLGMVLTKLGELYQKREVLSYSVKENNPGLIIIDKEIDMTRKNLEENLNNLIHNTEISQNYINGRVNTIDKRLASLPQTEQEFINIKRKFDINNTLYTFLLQKRAEAQITAASNVPDAFVIDQAREETANKIYPNVSKNYIMGLLIGLLLPVIWFFITEFFDNSIREVSTVEKGTRLSVVGSIAHNPYDIEMMISKYPRSTVTESFRGLRTNLAFMLPEPHQQVVSINSVIPGEGKSFISLNLAAVVALNNKKVVLIGCDMRRPRLSSLLNIPNEKGLSTYLINHNTLDEILIPSEIENLTVINSGPIPPNPSELLDTPRWDELIKQLKTRFDYIVLDNAPLSLVTDAFVAGRNADVNIVILRLNSSHKDEIKYVNKIAAKGNLKNVTVVMNDVKASGYGYGRRYGYGYGYGSSKNEQTYFTN